MCNVTYFESNRMTENVYIEFIIFENKYIILYVYIIGTPVNICLFSILI